MNNENLVFIDTHAHIYLEDFDKERQEILRKAEEKGVKKIYMPNLDHTSIDALLETEDRNASCIAMMGLHPCYVKKGFERDLYLVEDWLNKKRFPAIGEIGIDLYWDTTTKGIQEEALKVQLELASKHQLPVVIHCRNSFHETVAIIEKTGKTMKGVFHCFSGTQEDARKGIELGFMLGIGGVITFKNSGLDKAIKDIPMEYLLLETDSPYLTPAPHRKLKNDPGYIPLIAEKLAAVKNITLKEVADTTTENAIKLFSSSL